MQIEHLHYILDIYIMRSISAASRHLHIAQTTLSAAVKSVENEVGFPVFKRTPAGVVPTEKGKALLDLSWKVTANYESLMSMRDHSDDSPQFFKVLISPVLPPVTLAGIAKRFEQFNSFGNIAFEEHHSMKIPPAIAKRRAGIGFVILGKQQFIRLQNNYVPDEVAVELLYEDELSCIVASDSPIAEKKSISVSEMKELALVFPSSPQDSGSILTELSSQLTDFCILPDIALLLAAVARHGFATILPHKTVENSIFLRNGECCSIPIVDEHYSASVCAGLCSRPFDRLTRHERFVFFCIRDLCSEKQNFAEENASEVLT